MHTWDSQGMEVTTYHSENILHMPDWLEMISRKLDNFTPDPQRQLSTIAREAAKVISNIQNTYLVTTQSWFQEISSANAHYLIWISSNMER